MVIDARGSDSRELFIKLKEILSTEKCSDVFIEILFDVRDATIQKARAFVSMSGCQTKIEKKNE